MGSTYELGTRRVAVVTGGNRGLGLATAKKLAMEGFHVVIAARDPISGGAAADAIRRELPGASAESMALDLSSLASVRDFAAAYRGRGLPLHLLVNNAGLIAFERLEKSAEGFELQFATNHLGHFLLTMLLEPVLRASAPARVVVVSSQMHMPGFGPGRGPDFRYDNLDGRQSYDAMVAYRNSKLANMWFAYALARRLEGSGVTVNALCPGFVPETGAASAHGVQRLMFRYVFPLLPQARTVDQASTHMAWVATAPELASVSGRFFVDRAERRSSDESYDVEEQERLWRYSEAAVGLSHRQPVVVGGATPTAMDSRG